MKLNIILPTLGRRSLAKTIASIPTSEEVEVILVADGHEAYARIESVKEVEGLARLRTAMLAGRTNDFGYTPRNVGLTLADGDWVAFIDDDCYFTAGGVEAMLEYCRRGEPTPAVFRMDAPCYGKVLWEEPVLRLGNMGLPQFLAPNLGEQLPRFRKHYEADFDWMQEVAERCGGCEFRETITMVSPVQSLGK